MGCGKALEDRANNYNAAHKAELQKIQTEITTTSRFFKSLYESLAQGHITQDEYAALKAGYEAKIADLTAQESNLRKTMLEHTTKQELTANVLIKLKSVRHISDLTAEAINSLVDKIIVHEDKSVDISFKFDVPELDNVGREVEEVEEVEERCAI